MVLTVGHEVPVDLQHQRRVLVTETLGDRHHRLPRGQQLFAGESTRLAYLTDEAVEGRDAFLQKRAPDWSPFPWYY